LTPILLIDTIYRIFQMINFICLPFFLSQYHRLTGMNFKSQKFQDESARGGLNSSLHQVDHSPQIKNLELFRVLPPLDDEKESP